MSDLGRGLPLLSGPPPPLAASSAQQTACRKCNRDFNLIFTRSKRCNHCGYAYCQSCTDYQALMPRENGYDAMSVCAYCIEYLTITAAGRAQLKSMPMGRLRNYLRAYNISTDRVVEKDDLIDAIVKARGLNGCLPPENEAYYRTYSVPNKASPTRSRGLFAVNRHGQASSAPEPPPPPTRQTRPEFARPDLIPDASPPSPPLPPPPPPPRQWHSNLYDEWSPPRRQRQEGPPQEGLPQTPPPRRRNPPPDLPPPPPPPRRPPPRQQEQRQEYAPPPHPIRPHASYPYTPPDQSPPPRLYTPSPDFTSSRSTSGPTFPTFGATSQSPPQANWPPRPTTPQPPRQEPPLPPRPRATSTAPTPSLDQLLTMTPEGIGSLSIGTLKNLLFANHVNVGNILEKGDLVKKVLSLVDDEKRERERQRQATEMEEMERIQRQMGAREGVEVGFESVRETAFSAVVNVEEASVQNRRPSGEYSQGSRSTAESVPPVASSSPPTGPSPPPKVVDRNGLCVICQDEEANIAIVDCGHLAMCKVCSELVMSSSRECPLCRTRIVTERRLLRIFKT